MDTVITYLKQLDLSDIEAKIYLTLLKTGPISIRDLAQTVDIKRTTAYLYVDQLAEKGLIIKLIHGSKKLISANEPEHLKILIEEKLKNAQKVEQDFPTILDLLNTSLPDKEPSVESEIKNYKGRNAVKSIYEEALRSQEIRALANLDEVAHTFPENAQLFDNAVNNNPRMKILELVVDTPYTRKRKEQAKQRTKAHRFKFLPKNMQLSSTDILIYEGNVSFIDIKNQVSAVTLHNNNLYNNFNLLFEFIWQTLPDPK